MMLIFEGTDNFFLSVPSGHRAQMGHRSFLTICALATYCFYCLFYIKGTEGTDNKDIIA